jgi:glycerol-3-phosphate dehydrogenase subunit B
VKRLVVIGAGLAGLSAACLARDHGASVTLIAAGRGGLALSSGRLDLWQRPLTRHAQASVPIGHPYRIVGFHTLDRAVNSFTNLIDGDALPFSGHRPRAWIVPTAFGLAARACIAPAGLVLEGPRSLDKSAIAGVQGFRDFSGALAAGAPSYRSAGWEILPDLPLPGFHWSRDPYASEIAAWLDRQPNLKPLAAAWRPLVSGIRRLAIPAVLGLRRHVQIRSELEAELGLRLLEIPTLPPSVPGMRLEAALRGSALRRGVRLIEGARAIGQVDGRTRGRKCSAVAAHGPGGWRLHPCDAVILATGGPLHGGWSATRQGQARETVFGFPIPSSVPDDGRTTTSFFQMQPYARMGLIVDRSLRPMGRGRRALLDNVFAAGGILAGADRIGEACRQGVDLATAYAAVESAVA